MKWNKILAAIMAIGILAAIYVGYGRFQTESHYKNYEITMDLEEIKKTAASAGLTVEESLLKWKEVGIDSITITEATISSLKSNNEYKVRTSFEGYDVVVEATEEGIAFIEKGLQEVVLGDRRLTKRSPTTLVIEGLASDLGVRYDIVRDYLEKKVGTAKIGHTSKVEEIGLGYVPSDIEIVKASGLPIQFRPSYIADVQDAEKSITRFVEAVQQHSKQSYAIFFGDTVLGTDTALEAMAKAMKENDIALAMIETGVQREHLEQTGLEPLAKALDYKAVRVFSTWNYIQKRFDYGMPGHHQGQEIMNTFYRAITERNIRVIFFKPFITSGHNLIADFPVYKERFMELENRLAEHGIHKMKHSEGERIMTMPFLRNRPAFQMLVALAVIAVFLIIVDNLIKIKAGYLYILFALAALPTAGLYLLQIRLKMLNVMFGLASTILFAVLAVQFVLAWSKKMYDKPETVGTVKAFGMAIMVFVVSVFVGLTGALAEVAFYANSEYLLEFGVFTGVKISQLFPLILVLLVSVRYFGNDILGNPERNPKERALTILNSNIKVWHAVVGFVMLAGVALLLIRSGHETGIQPASFELYVRNILEELVLARPRNKAFLLGYPGLLLLVTFAYQKRYKLAYPVLALVAGVGHANLLNTFSHIRTPLYLSFWRIFFEVVFSIAMTILYLGVIEAVVAIFHRFKGKWNLSE